MFLSDLFSYPSQQQKEDAQFALEFVSTLIIDDPDPEEESKMDKLTSQEFDLVSRTISLVVAVKKIGSGACQDKPMAEIISSIGVETMEQINSMSVEECRAIAFSTQQNNERGYAAYLKQSTSHISETSNYEAKLRQSFASIYDAELAEESDEQIRWVKMFVDGREGTIECDAIPMNVPLLELTIDVNDFQFEGNHIPEKIKRKWQTVKELPKAARQNPDLKYVVLNLTIQDLQLFHLIPKLDKESFVEASCLLFSASIECVNGTHN